MRTEMPSYFSFLSTAPATIFPEMAPALGHSPRWARPQVLQRKTHIMHKIALEEHFVTDEMVPYFGDTYVNISKDMAKRGLVELLDFGSQRLDLYGRGCIMESVLSLSRPAAQIELETAKAVRLTRVVNDHLADEVARCLSRYEGFAHLAMQIGNQHPSVPVLDPCLFP